MQRSDFHYHLPDDLIAQHPPANRGDSRLLVVDGAGGVFRDSRFADLTEVLSPGDLLVFNRSRVIPARLFARKDTGGAVEILVERVCGTHEALAHLRASKTPRPGGVLHLEGGARIVIGAREGHGLWQLTFDEPVASCLETHGHVPLPPYIRRADEPADRERYQTVYADRPGAVAAPTAGLHFDEAMLARLADQGIASAFLTLHVGAGTFQPLRDEDLAGHHLHAERYDIDAAVCERIAAARAERRRVVAVGTTTVRALEAAAAQTGTVCPGAGETTLFIVPGYRFRVVDALLTNFHLPGSTLLMLVAAFAGLEHTKRAYAHAVQERYRFYSYGDAMFVTPQQPRP